MSFVRKYPFYFILYSLSWQISSVHASVNLIDSTQTVIDQVFVLGNKKTQRSIIMREMALKPGKSYAENQVEQLAIESKNRIYNTGLFNDVSIEVLWESKYKASVLVKVEERWYFYPIPMMQIDDRNFMDWIVNRGNDLNRINYGIRFEHFNFRGMNERISFLGQMGFQRQLLFKYTAPFIDKKQRHGLILEGAYLERENLAYRTVDHLPTFNSSIDINRRILGGLVTYIHRPDFYNFHYFTLGLRQGNISDSIAMLNPNYYGDGRTRQRYANFVYTYVNDHRNFRNYPTQGDYTKVMVERKGLLPGDDLSMNRITGRYSRFFEIAEKNSAAVSILGYTSFPVRQPYFNYGAIGFNEFQLRGFELDLIESPNFVIAKSELRRKLVSYHYELEKETASRFNDFKFIAHAKVFTDVGYAQNYPDYELSKRLTDTWLYAIGTGIDIILLYDTVIRFEYSYTSKGNFNFAINARAAIH